MCQVNSFTWHQLAKLRPTTPEEVVEVLKKVSSQTSNALPSFLECNKNISKYLPFHLEKLLFGSFQKGMLREMFFACGSLVIYFRGGGSQETHQQKHTHHPQTIPSEGRSIWRSSSFCGGYCSATSGLGHHGGERASSVEGGETRRRTFLQGAEDWWGDPSGETTGWFQKPPFFFACSIWEKCVSNLKMVPKHPLHFH